MSVDRIDVDPALDLVGYGTYVDGVESLARRALAGETRIDRTNVVLDGAPSRELRRLTALEARRRRGAFFTTSAIRDGAFCSALPDSPASTGALDPACGAGDLLIRWSDRLPTAPTLEETLAIWGSALHGVDQHDEFVRLTRARLVLAAAARCSNGAGGCELDGLFPNVVCGDGIEVLRGGRLPSWVLQNPPFGMADAPPWFVHGEGLVSQAAVFVTAWAESAAAGTRMVALLPEVLRTGSRYQAWRDSIREAASIVEVVPLGQFDVDVDIDVFLLSLRRAKVPGSGAPWWTPPPAHLTSALRGSPIVSVGTVVPHRDPEEGPRRRFLTAANLPRLREAEAPDEWRRYAGKVFQPPFVAVRRTSRPGQFPRAFATVVVGTEAVAVENHLLVVEPRIGGVSECRRIARILAGTTASEWLDHRLGGRHLTTIALAEALEVPT